MVKAGLRATRGRSFLAADHRTGSPVTTWLNPARRRWRAGERADLSAEEAQAAPDLVLVDDGGSVPVADAMLVS